MSNLQKGNRAVDPRALAAAGKSPGLWRLAWKRLLRDKIGFFSMLIVLGFVLLAILSRAGLVAKDWNKEVGINYAPPVFAPNTAGAGLDAPINVTAPSQTGDSAALPFTFSTGVKDPLEAEMKEIYAQLGRGGAVPAAQSGAPVYQSTIVDPLADDIAAIRKELGRPDPSAAAIPAAQISTYKGNIVDPLAEDVAAINKELGRTGATTGAITVAAAAEKKIERSPTLAFGGDKWGRDVLSKVIKGTETSLVVGLAGALVATVIGTVFGAVSGYFGGWIDDLLTWFYNIFSSIPYLLLILAVAAVVNSKGAATIIIILGATGWASIARLVRAEYMKHKSREYVQAATALGASDMRKMFVHIFPNVSHVALVQLSLHVVLFIKSEVILSFLGFGVGVDTVSWGSMLNEAQSELILGKWWQLGAATLFMAVLVTAFSLFTDALRDALDPKLK
jgi:peptide/nickel transport system permease protein